MHAIITAANDEGIDFQLNARTDAIARGGDRPLKDSIDDAIARGRTFLDAGASLVFVPGALTREVIEPLVEGLGRGKLSVIGAPAHCPQQTCRNSGSPASPTAPSPSVSPCAHSANWPPTSMGPVSFPSTPHP
ncbi:hypothetical protein ABIB45_003127 [Arthrobacter sp. UYCo732]